MESNRSRLFDFLKRSNLERYTESMLTQEVTLERLLEFDENEIRELARELAIPLGHKHDLNKLIKLHNNSEIALNNNDGVSFSIDHRQIRNEIVADTSMNSRTEGSSSIRNQVAVLFRPFDDCMKEIINIGLLSHYLDLNSIRDGI